jgi:secondary thiamine-phosphate synthase enzyme
MTIESKQVSINSRKRNEMIDITSQVQSALNSASVKNGFVIVFCPHTTAAITVNENADPDVTSDMLLTLDELIPNLRPGYRHSEGNSDAHVKSSLVGCSEQILVKDGKLVLGTWQGIYFCEFDGPRSRNVIVQFQGE